MKKQSEAISPKFFCENCSNEVKRNTRVCPHCGRFFASVKCPSCNFAGSSDEFLGGCPSCGYAVNSESGKKTNKNKKGKNYKNNSYKTNKYDDPLPWWIYSLVIGLLGVLIIVALLMP